MPYYQVSITKNNVKVQQISSDKFFIAMSFDKIMTDFLAIKKKTIASPIAENEEIPSKSIFEKAPESSLKEQTLQTTEDFLAALKQKVQSNPDLLRQERNEKSLSVQNDAKSTKKQPQTALDFLILGSYYLNEVEKHDKYSLHQINEKVAAISDKTIDHSIIRDAVSKNLLEIVPDKSNLSLNTEYKITKEGRQYIEC
ncbi:MAG: hypothetical protein PHV68_08730 [Candidatus Gastranaerophilales bacterium]|nr:hypothetical protein [Candidatus Gastranaerophilales bacterium]